MTRMRFIIALFASLFLGTSLAHAQQKVDVTGKWAFEVVTENGTGTPTVTFKQEGDKLTGTYESQRLGTRSLEGTVKGETITFALKSGDGAPTLTFTGVLVDKDHMKGDLDMGGMGSASFTGKRAP